MAQALPDGYDRLLQPSDTADLAEVRLGFLDGSGLHLSPDDPHALALKAIADALIHKDSPQQRGRT
jgi:hypothetical protein